MSNAPLVIRQITRIARRNVGRNWRHSLATLLAIASGFMAISLLDGFLSFLKTTTVEGVTKRSMYGQVVIHQHGATAAGYQDQWAHSLNVEEQRFLLDFIKSDADTAHYSRFLNMYGVATAGDQSGVFAGFGYDTKEGAAIRGENWSWTAVAGQPLDKANEPSISLGMGLAHILGCEAQENDGNFVRADASFEPATRPFTCKEPNVTLSVSTEGAQANIAALPVVGIIDVMMREVNRRMVQMDLTTAQQLLDTDKISFISVELKRPSLAKNFIVRLNAAAKSRGYDFEIMEWNEVPVAQPVIKALRLQEVVNHVFMSIVVFIVVMSIANTMMKAVNERTREIGTLRSLGFLRNHLILMFSLEGMFLALLACGVGLGMTLVASQLIQLVNIKFDGGMLSFPLTLTVNWVPLSWVANAILLTVLATVTACLASRRACGMVIADAMRHV